MAKKKQYICQECGSIQSKWAGKCEDCNSWNSIVEDENTNIFQSQHQTKIKSKDIEIINFVDLEGDIQKVTRVDTNSIEMNRVLGGGLVPSSVILIGGQPGIGKSTLLLSIMNRLSRNNMNTVYISGEESIDQIRLRAKRMGIEKSKIKLAVSTSVENIIASIKQSKCEVLVIDSIQTMFVKYLDATCGSVSQLRASSHELMSYCKTNKITLLLIGHVTKDGTIAGPKLLEHMVDTVLYFEGEKGNQFRILRAVKNRFGSTNEIGIFEMKSDGLIEVLNPSAMFISKFTNISGNVIFTGIEGTRPILAEVQTLISQSYLPTPRRAVVGWDNNRMSMLIAVLQSRYGLSFANKDVYLNIAGGLKIQEPAVDLAVIISLISAMNDIAIPEGVAIWGEVGLSGEVRQVPNTDIRLQESIKLGFVKAIIPQDECDYDDLNIKIYKINHIRQLKSMMENI